MGRLGSGELTFVRCVIGGRHDGGREGARGIQLNSRSTAQKEGTSFYCKYNIQKGSIKCTAYGVKMFCEKGDR